MTPLPALIRVGLEKAKSPMGAFVIGAIGIALAVYATWFNDKHASLSVSVYSNSAVLSEGANVSDIDVYFKGTKLDLTRTPLRILLVRLWNDGDVTIRTGDFDPSAPVGFQSSAGQFLYASLENASNDYLRNSAKVHVQDQNRVTLEPLILEPRDAIVVKAMLLYTGKIEPVIKPAGKVAGVAEITERFPLSRIPGRVERYVSAKDRLQDLVLLGGVVTLAIGNFAFSLIQAWRKRRRSP